MSEILDQSEIDALLGGAAPGTTCDAPASAGQSATSVRYNFDTQTRIVRGRMPTLEMVNERLVRSLRPSLYRMLRRPPEIKVLGITTQRFASYTQTLAVPTSLNLVRVHPLAGLGLLLFEAKLVFALVDAYYCGTGRHAKIEGRDFTIAENDLIQELMEAVIAAFEDAWSPVLTASVQFVSREMNPQFAGLSGPTELVVVSKIRVDIDGKGGEIHITLPYSMLEPIKDTLRAGLQSDQADRAERWGQRLRDEIEDSSVEIVTRVGSAPLSVRSLIEMRPGDIVPIDFDGRATVILDGLPLFKGELAQQSGRLVVLIDEVSVRKTTNSLDALVKSAGYQKAMGLPLC